MADAVPLARFPAGADLRMDVYAGGQLIWVLHRPPGGLRADSVTLPPSLGIESPVSVQLGALSVIVQAERIPLPPHGELYRRVAISHDMTLRRH